jgi:hypothetical protein
MMRLWLDTRMGGHPVWRLVEDDEVPMIVSDELRKCVVFIYFDDKKGVRRAAGTAFFVSLDRGHGIQGHWTYLVTAKHVLDGIRAERADGMMFLRVNLKGAGFAYVDCSVNVWTTHPNETLIDDVAVLPWTPPAEVDYLSYPLESSVNEETGHSVGDEVFLPGLFVNHAGKERNIPIVRIGNIAAMPSEPVESQIGPLDAYLVEARSIGGLSGSPVFVNLGLYRKVGDKIMQARESEVGVHRLLGLMHGHWRVQPPKEVPKGDDATLDAISDEWINMGIAIVAPVERIIATINHPKQAQAREKTDREAAEKMLPVMDAAAQSPQDDEFERFEDLASKLVQVPKSELDGKLKES